LLKNFRITTVFFICSSLIFLLCIFFTFLISPYFHYWSYLFNILSFISIFFYILIGFKLEKQGSFVEVLPSLVLPSILSCMYWILLFGINTNVEDNGMFGSSIIWIFYYPVISHSILIINVLKEVFELNLYFLLPLNFIPVILFLIGIYLKELLNNSQ
jgi:hypothetical protein